MNLKFLDDVTFSVAALFLKLVGFWLPASRVEEWLNNTMIIYTFISVSLYVVIELRYLYFSWGNFTLCTSIACYIMVPLVDVLKLSIVYVKKKEFLKLVVYMQKNFCHFNYDRYENTIMAATKRICMYFVCIFSFFLETTVLFYILIAVTENIGRDESERELMFDLFLDLPLNKTPYYEIAFAIEIFCLYYVGLCYHCFDNMFCMMCLHVAGQFRILQYRVANMPNVKNEKGHCDPSGRAYATLKDCIQQHKDLIKFCSSIEEIFTAVIFVQVSAFSILICFTGYQLILSDLATSWRMMFTCFLIVNMSHLWIFTYSCDYVAQESVNLASAWYAGPWTHLPMDKFGKMMRRDLQLVIMRSGRPCYLTAGNFFPVSLETYTKIMSSAMSYFTLLKQSTADTTDA